MQEKGLCSTCENDKSCVFQGKFPVLQCEEFTSSDHHLVKIVSLQQKKSECFEEETIAE